MDTHGRTAERAVLAAVVDGTRAARSGVLVLRGPAGVGKSTLLKDAVRRGEDLCVLHARGVESEAEFAFGALHQLLRPVLGHAVHLPAHQTAALRVAIGLEQGAAPDRFLVALAVLGLLAGVAEAAPVVCLVDDAQWLDHASASVLLFVARRLVAERVGMLFAARDGDGDGGFPAAGLPELVLAGLDRDATRALLDERSAGPVDGAVVTRLLDWTEGNPLALIELPSLLTPDQLAGHTPLPVPLPATASVERIFAERAGLLSAAALTLLLVAAAEESGRLATILAAGRELGAGEATLVAVEHSGLVAARGGTLAFSHPLVRSAVYQAASAVARHEVHRALARVVGEAGDPDQRAWHLAAATLVPDEIVVRELDETAERARRRGGFGAAATALQRGAELTASGQARCRRLLLAAENAWLAGQFSRVSGLLAAARPLATEPLLRADIGRLRGWLEISIGSPAAAHRILVEAARDAAPLDAPRARVLLAAAAESAWLAGDRQAGAELAAVAAQLPPADDDRDRFEADLLAGFLRHVDGDGAGAVLLLTATIETAERIGTDDLLALAAHPGLLRRRRRRRAAAQRAGRRQGTGHRRGGRPAVHPAAAGAGRPGARQLDGGGGRSSRGRSAGRRDRPGRARRAAAGVARAARRAARGRRGVLGGRRAGGRARRHPPAGRLPGGGLGGRAVGARDAEDGDGPPGVGVGAAGRPHPPGRRRHGDARPDRRSGPGGAPGPGPRPAPADRRGRRAHRRRGGQARAAHCRGLLADGAVATRHFAEALTHHARSHRPFERARTELAHGEALRRSRRRVDARPTSMRRLARSRSSGRCRGRIGRVRSCARAGRPPGAATRRPCCN